MPKPPSQPGKGPAARGSSSRRVRPSPVSKPFPWGTVVGSLVLVLVLGGILVYALLNQGGGLDDELANPDSIKGVVVDENLAEVARDHVATPVDYPQSPPNAGMHNTLPQTCAIYTEPIANEHAVHSLEHGAVWITYNSSVPQDQIDALAAQVDGNQYRMLSPIPDQASPIDVSAWGRRLSVKSANDDRVTKFLRGFTNGPQTPEPGSACAGTTATGPFVPAPGEVPPPGTPPLPAPSSAPAG